MTWADMLKLDDEKLQTLGMSALGARYGPDRAGKGSSVVGEGANGDPCERLIGDAGVAQPETAQGGGERGEWRACLADVGQALGTSARVISPLPTLSPPVQCTITGPNQCIRQAFLQPSGWVPLPHTAIRIDEVHASMFHTTLFILGPMRSCALLWALQATASLCLFPAPGGRCLRPPSTWRLRPPLTPGVRLLVRPSGHPERPSATAASQRRLRRTRRFFPEHSMAIWREKTSDAADDDAADDDAADDDAV